MTDEQDDIGQLIATAVSVAEALYQAIHSRTPGRDKNIDRMAHEAEVKMLGHAAFQISIVASLADSRREANRQIKSEDRKLVRIA
jgi:hypothetical protein